MRYSQERKQAVLAKLAPPHQRTVKDVAAEEGISPATLYHWRQQARLTSLPCAQSQGTGPVRAASSRPPWIVMHARRCEHWNANCSARRKRWPLRLRAGQADQHPGSPVCGIAELC